MTTPPEINQEPNHRAIKREWYDRQPTPRSLHDIDELRRLWQRSAEFRDCLSLLEDELGYSPGERPEMPALPPNEPLERSAGVGWQPRDPGARNAALTHSGTK